MKLFKFKNKKGQVLNGLGQLGVGIAALAILLTVAFLIMSQGKEQVVDLISTTTFTNQTVDITTDAYVGFPCITTETLSVTIAYNNTGTAGPEGFGVINTGNYTVLNNMVNFSDDNLGDYGPLPSAINMSYSCKQPDHAYNGTSTLQDATSDIPGWIPLIVVVVIGALLLSLIALFRRNQ